MSHWMTSGRNRLKAKEDRSFAHRAQSRATFMGFKPRNRNRSNGPRAVQESHPRFYKRTAMEDLGSSKSCPIARRGIVAVAGSRPSQRREGETGNERGDGAGNGNPPAMPTQPERRIRNAKAFQQSSTFVIQKQSGSNRQNIPRRTDLLSEQRHAYMENLKAQAQEYAEKEKQRPRRRLLAQKKPPDAPTQQAQYSREDLPDRYTQRTLHQMPPYEEDSFLSPTLKDNDFQSSHDDLEGSGWDDFRNLAQETSPFQQHDEPFVPNPQFGSGLPDRSRELPPDIGGGTAWDSAPPQQSGQGFGFTSNDGTTGEDPFGEFNQYQGEDFDDPFDTFDGPQESFQQPYVPPLSSTIVSQSTASVAPNDFSNDPRQACFHPPPHDHPHNEWTAGHLLPLHCDTNHHRRDGLIHGQQNPSMQTALPLSSASAVRSATAAFQEALGNLCYGISPGQNVDHRPFHAATETADDAACDFLSLSSSFEGPGDGGPSPPPTVHFPRRARSNSSRAAGSHVSALTATSTSDRNSDDVFGSAPWGFHENDRNHQPDFYIGGELVDYDTGRPRLQGKTNF